jgi:Protein of unknown function (DUF2950)
MTAKHPLIIDGSHIAMDKTFSAAVKPIVLTFGIGALCWNGASLAAAKPESFASPDKAVDALVTASRNNDSSELLTLFGPAGKDLISSGDPVADRDARARFVERFGKGEKILSDTANRATLVIGTEEWPFPIPLVKQGGVWHFDAAAGAQEILNRRIGRNELSAIAVCRNYVVAQREYAADLVAENQPVEYAQKIVSSPGLRDGLYWQARVGESESPLGPQMAHAHAEGYDSGDEPRAPYHGYFYKVLTRQGAAAPGGTRDYIVGGHMTVGFSLIAFPAKYGDSGVMTFVVNQAGIVFEKDLGPNTAGVASAIAEFNPDATWKTR